MIATAMDGVPLKDYIERIFDEREKALQLAFKAQQEALAIATTALNRELEHLNNLREEINEARRDFVTRTEYRSAHDLVVDKVDKLEKRQESNAGKSAGVNILWQIGLSVLGAAGTVAIILGFIKH